MKDIKTFYERLAEDYPESIMYPFCDLIEHIGFEAIYILSDKFGGTTLYIPRPRTLFKEPMDEVICKEFDGGNYAKLALKYELCEKSIRNIVNKRY